MDVDAEDKQLADLHIDLGPAEVDLTRQCNLGGNVFTDVDSGGDELFKERGLRMTCQ